MELLNEPQRFGKGPACTSDLSGFTMASSLPFYLVLSTCMENGKVKDGHLKSRFWLIPSNLRLLNIGIINRNF
jgi:hypothetical protein